MDEIKGRGGHRRYATAPTVPAAAAPEAPAANQ
jgi:hypothetical protein